MAEVDRSETAENIAFEAEHGQTPAGSQGEELTEELPAQTMERLGPQMEVAGWYMGRKSEIRGQISEGRERMSGILNQQLTGLFRLLVITPTTAGWREI